MKIPNARNAFVDLAKLEDYALNTEHRVGKHKARLFAATLGMAQKDAKILREVLLTAVVDNDATLGLRDEHGQRYQIDFMLNRQASETMIRSVWIVRTDEDFPRLVSCYPLRR